MKKFLAVALAAVCFVSMLSLTSCSNSASSNTLTIGVDDTYPPMEFKDTSSTQDVGFDVELATEIGKRMNKTVKFQSTTWDGIFAALNSKKFDCIISSVSMKQDRITQYAFTKPYIANAQMIVVKKGDSSITSQKDLSGKNIGCQVSTTSSESADKLKKNGMQFNLSTYDQIIQCFQALKSNKISAIIVDDVVGEYYIAKNPDDYQAASVKLTNEPIGVCFRKSDTALRDQVQKAIDAIVADGTMKKLSEKWFGKDLTSDIDTKLKEMD
jgi:polar amino acid transport system substrate-binding protein